LGGGFAIQLEDTSMSEIDGLRAENEILKARNEYLEKNKIVLE